MTNDFRQSLRHSQRDSDDGECDSLSAVFAIEDDVFVCLTDSSETSRCRVTVWANTEDRAQKELECLMVKYVLPDRKRRQPARFHVLTVGAHGHLQAQAIRVASAVKRVAELKLNYGPDFCLWNNNFISQLRQPKVGLSILQGAPGTGKTSYLKYLLYELRRTHRFYYLPVTVYPLLASPNTADFWIGQNASHRCKKVVFIEDAERLLMARGSDNQDALSNLLNIADGFLGEYLQLQVICSINTPIDKLDPAITRPGRLIAWHEFKRLTPDQAAKLAAVKNITLLPQESYSLAEIYSHPQDTTLPACDRAAIGFSR